MTGGEGHHDVEVQDETGRRLGKARLPEGVAGMARLHALIVEQLGQDGTPEQVAVGIETDRGRWVAALVAAGYRVYPINPLQVARYRERHSTSGAKATPVMRTRWPAWSAPTGTSCGRRPGTATAGGR
jgi:Transposase